MSTTKFKGSKLTQVMMVRDHELLIPQQDDIAMCLNYLCTVND